MTGNVINVGKYLDYKNCKCRKEPFDKLVEKCSENINGNEMVHKTILSENVCNSCTIYIVLFVIFLTISIRISSVFICFHWYLKIRCIQTKIY